MEYKLVQPLWKTVLMFLRELKIELPYDPAIPPISIYPDKMKAAQSCWTLCDPHGLQPTRLLYPWNFLGKNTGVDCHFFLQISFQPRDQTQISHITGRFFSIWATREISPFKMIYASLYLQQHYSQQPKHGNNLNMHW